jgi:hypothetical protein
MESSLLACSSLDPIGAKKVSRSEQDSGEDENHKKLKLSPSFDDVTYGSTQRCGGMALVKNRALSGQALLSRHNQGNQSEVARFTVDSALQLVTVRFGKTVSAGDIERYATQLRESPSFRPGFSEIADLRDVEKLDLRAEEFIRLADKVDPFSFESKRAFVVRNSVQAHAARMHKILRTQRSFEIFHSLEEAEQWISSPEPAAPPKLGPKPSRRLP